MVDRFACLQSSVHINHTSSSKSMTYGNTLDPRLVKHLYHLCRMICTLSITSLSLYPVPMGYPSLVLITCTWWCKMRSSRGNSRVSTCLDTSRRLGSGLRKSASFCVSKSLSLKISYRPLGRHHDYVNVVAHQQLRTKIAFDSQGVILMFSLNKSENNLDTILLRHVAACSALIILL